MGVGRSTEFLKLHVGKDTACQGNASPPVILGSSLSRPMRNAWQRSRQTPDLLICPPLPSLAAHGPFQPLLHKLSQRLPRNKRIGSLLTAPGWGGGLWDDIWAPLARFSPHPHRASAQAPPPTPGCPGLCSGLSCLWPFVPTVPTVGSISSSGSQATCVFRDPLLYYAPPPPPPSSLEALEPAPREDRHCWPVALTKGRLTAARPPLGPSLEEQGSLARRMEGRGKAPPHHQEEEQGG